MADDYHSDNFDDGVDDQPNVEFSTSTELSLIQQGAEARLYKGVYLGKPVIVKERFVKKYRHSVLDDHLSGERMKSEIRCLLRCSSLGVAVPPVYFVDSINRRITMGFIEGAITVRQYITEIQNEKSSAAGYDFYDCLRPLVTEIGRVLAVLHENDVIHGDLTTSNMLIRQPYDKTDVVLIDFGLSYIERLIEDKAVDLYVLEKAFISTHPNSEKLFGEILKSYESNYQKRNAAQKVLSKLDDVRLRGRKRLMIG